MAVAAASVRCQGMRRLLLAFFVVLFGGLPACHGRGGTTTLPELAVAAAVTGGGRVLLDPLGTRVLLGTILLQNTLATSLVDGGIVFRLLLGAGYEADETEVVLTPGQRREIAIYTTLVVATSLTLAVRASYQRGGPDREYPVAWTNEAGGNRALQLLQLLQTAPIVALWYSSLVLAPVGVLTNNSNRLVPRRLPALAQEVRLYAALLLYLSLFELQTAFGGSADVATFPPGQGPEGFTVAATPSAPLAAGDHCVFTLAVQEPIPLADPTQRFQYAFVFDSDLAAGNNWVPAPAFLDDFFAGTDRWYELNYAPSTGWQLRCRTVAAGNVLATVPSAARAILSGDTLLLVVPRSEFVVANPPFRATTFAHLGDFGQNPPYTWSGDPTPTVAEGLRSWQ
jgi:hypothetical protein